MNEKDYTLYKQFSLHKNAQYTCIYTTNNIFCKNFKYNYFKDKK